MYKLKNIIICILLLAFVVSVAACSPVDKDYGVTSDTTDTEEKKFQDIAEVGDEPIMSSDRVMSKYFDISLFDEENYADIYLGKRFKIDAVFTEDAFAVPTTIKKMGAMGWTLADGNIYNENSLVFAYETIDAIFVNENNVKVFAQFYNSSKSSVKLSECNIVKFRIENDFYTNPENYHSFNINGIVNSMAITDIIDTLGTPSHFYEVSDECYYLDYFITKKDRRNGITVYINPIDDCILSVEFSYYK